MYGPVIGDRSGLRGIPQRRNLKVSLENSLREVEMRYAMEMEQLKGILLHLESELAHSWPRPRQRGSNRPRSMRPC